MLINTTRPANFKQMFYKNIQEMDLESFKIFAKNNLGFRRPLGPELYTIILERMEKENLTMDDL